jgi:DNA/RNA-binding domain of Phe-tRNA-synthetase-like protein
MDPDAIPAEGFIAPEVRAELPGLRLRWTALDGPFRTDFAALRARLRALSNRFLGADAITMRTRPVDHAYRAFFRQTGLDPDVQRTPAEQAALSRLLHGGLSARDPLHAAMLIAVVETGVGVWGLDGNRVDAGGLGIRQTGEREQLGEGDHRVPVSPGRLVIADPVRIHALLFGELAPGHEAGRASRRAVFFSVGVDGVPEVHLAEALWLTVEALGGGAAGRDSNPRHPGGAESQQW